jgi:LuxR family maltose regulon positive regulatory protein
VDDWVANRPTLASQRRGVEAQLSFVLGSTDRAQHVLDDAPEVEGLEISHERVRLALARDDIDAARLFLKHWPEQPQPRAGTLQRLWNAVVASMDGDEPAAIRHLGAVMPELEEEGNVGILLDVGRPVLGPLRSLYRVAPTPFVRKMVAHPALAVPRNASSIRGLAEQLTSQEMVVLGYLPSWLSNAGIAEQLGVSINTIKTHLKHIYRKLDVTDRKDAIDVAERLGLL